MNNLIMLECIKHIQDSANSAKPIIDPTYQQNQSLFSTEFDAQQPPPDNETTTTTTTTYTTTATTESTTTYPNEPLINQIDGNDEQDNNSNGSESLLVPPKTETTQTTSFGYFSGNYSEVQKVARKTINSNLELLEHPNEVETIDSYPTNDGKYVIHRPWSDSDNFSEVQKVARKTINSKSCGNKSSHQLFQNEVNILKRVEHPNVVKIIDSRTTNDGEYVINLQWFDGGSLESFIIENKHAIEVLPEIRLQIIKDIANGIHHLHQMNITHRDLTPSNILLSIKIDCKELSSKKDSSEYRSILGKFYAVVSDFGLSTINDEWPASVGNRSHLAPEVLSGSYNTKESDIYSFGIIIWQLFTFIIIEKDMPISGTQCKKSYLPLTVPKEWDDLMFDCLNEEKTKRPTIQKVLNSICDIEKSSIKV